MERQCILNGYANIVVLPQMTSNNITYSLSTSSVQMLNKKDGYYLKQNKRNGTTYANSIASVENIDVYIQ